MVFVIKIIYFLLPAGMANMAPVLFNKINFLNYPIDFGLKFLNKPIFGANKTYRGIFFGILLAIVTVKLQVLLADTFHDIELFDYSKINPYILGLFLGFGALFGDLIESFFKRRLNINPGEPWIPFDQIDWVLGALFFSFFYVKINLIIVFWSLIIFCILHVIVNYLGYILKMKKNKF